MSQYGYLIFYTCESPSDPQVQLLRLLDFLGVRHVYSVFRTPGEERGWELFQENLNSGEWYMEDWSNLNVPNDAGPKELAALYEEGTCLRLDVKSGHERGANLGMRVYVAVENGVPESIRGRFIPGGPHISIGYHDIFESVMHEEGLFIARAFTSVEFFGYGSPHDWEEMPRLTYQLPEIIAVRKELEAILGPLQEFMRWSV